MLLLICSFVVCARANGAVTWQEGFEDDTSAWIVEGSANVWQIGVPTSGPGSAYSGTRVAATRLAGNYPSSVDARLISPEFEVPAGEKPRLRFWSWHATYETSDFGQLEVRINGGTWAPLPERMERNTGAAWTQRIIDLSDYVGQRMQLGFRFVSDLSGVAAGWYVDGLAVETGPLVFSNPEGFENGFGDWSVEGSVWQIGVPTSGPGSAHSGTRVAGTILGADYPLSVSARLISPEFTVPAGEKPRLRFWSWHSTYQTGHYGEVQIRTGEGTVWTPLTERMERNTGVAWTQRIVDLSDYVGQVVQLGFYFESGLGNNAAGWYVDDLAVETGPLVFSNPEGFENGFGDWSVEGSVWQIGVPTSGPGSAHSGTRVAGTILGADYPLSVSARLISPEFTVPAGEKPRLRFWSWHSTYQTGHYGEVQIRTGEGTVWTPLTERMERNTGVAWTQRIVDLSDYVGQVVQLGFYFESGLGNNAAGWYVDDLAVETGPLVFSNPEGFENGFGDWSVEGSVWQIGVPTSGPGGTHSGTRVAGTILGGNYPSSVDARLISPEFVVPVSSANPQLSFWHWFDASDSGDNGRVQISTNGTSWSDFTPLFSAEWTRQLIDLTAYAGQAIRLSFYFHANISGVASGWYVDDVEIISDTLDPLGNQIIAEGAEFHMPLVSRGDSLMFSFSGVAPAGATVGPSAPEFTWTPAETQGPGIYTNITIWVTQSGNSLTPIDRQSFDITVEEVNLAPTLTTPPTRTIGELTPLEVLLSASDADVPVNTLTFSLVSAPGGMTIDADSGAIAWTSTEAQGPSTNIITVVVTDDNPVAVNAQHLSTTNSFTVVVQEVNTPPQLTVPGDATINEMATLSVSASATDGDVPANPLVFRLSSPPVGMTINADSGAITWTPTEAQGPSTNTIAVVVTDSNPLAVNPQELSVTNTFVVVVSEVNAGPVLPPQDDHTIDELTVLTVTNTATDADLPANSLAYTLLVAPSGASISSGGVITWTPAETQGPGTNIFTIVVMDTNAPAVNEKQISATNTFTVVVSEVNTAPHLTIPLTQTIDEMALLDVLVSATDADVPANTLTFSLVSASGGMTIDADSGAISWATTEAQGPSTNTITVVVTDDNPMAVNAQRLSTTNSFTVIVAEVNTPPQLTVPGDETINELTVLSVSASATDADLEANPLMFSLASSPAGVTIDADSGAITWTPTEAQGPSTNTITVVVTDTNPSAVNATQLSVTNTFIVVVDEVNVAPALPSQIDQTIDELTLFRVANGATDTDLPANPLSYALLSSPQGVSVNPDGTLVWTPSEEQGPSTNMFTVVVSDTNALAVNEKRFSVTNSFKVVVREVNRPPLLTAVSDLSVHAGVSIAIALGADDPDLPTNTLVFSLVTGPVGAQIVPGTGLISWQPLSSQVGPTAFEVSVQDNGLPAMTASERFSVTVVDLKLLILNSEGNLTLRIPTVAGDHYQVEFKNELDNPAWQAVDPGFTGTGSVLEIEVPLETGTPHRFYRLLRN